MLTFCGGLGLFSSFFDLGSEVNNLAAVIIPAFHADGVTLVLRATVATFRKTHLIQGVMRAPIVSVRSRSSHSIYHNVDILT